MRRFAAVLMVSAMAPALVVVPTLGHGAAQSHPVAPALTFVELTGVDSRAWEAEALSPAASDPEVALWGRESEPAAFTARSTTAGYSLVGITWEYEQHPSFVAEDLDIAVRTRTGGQWQPWVSLATDSGDRPDEGEGAVPLEEPEGGGRPARAGTSPYFAGPSDGIQVWVDSQQPLPVGLRADLVDPGSSAADDQLVASAPSAAHAAAGLPAVISRSQWGAVESLRNAGPTYEPKIKALFVHHTATSNSYTKSQAAAAVRSIYAYDTNSLGWSDIAYNVIVDKYGQIFEGRYGGLEHAVRSGATGGFNAKTWALAALGNNVDLEPSDAQLTSIKKILAWKVGIAHLDPTGQTTLTAANGSGTTAKYKDGTKVAFDVISGHRDAGATACPGARLYAKLPSIRSGAASLIGAQLYDTSASPLLVAKGKTTPVRIKATAMTAQDWRLEVKKQGTSEVIRTYDGSASAGAVIDVSWNLNDSAGEKVTKGVYTVTLQSWNGQDAAVPFAVNVGLFGDPDVFERPADGVFRLEGRGYGHGHGLSQFGAEGAARKGLTRSQILSFYYPGTTTVKAPAKTKIRVQLAAAPRKKPAGQDVRLRPVAGLTVTEGARTTLLPVKLGGRTVSAWRTLLAGDGSLGVYGWTGSKYNKLKGWAGLDGPVTFTNAADAPTTARLTLIRNTGQEVVYRGSILVRRNASRDTLNAVSVVLLDDYVKSVVSAEMPGGWTSTAYQAQAVAARSYAMFKRSAAQAAGSPWHICDSTQCQVYNGYSGETTPESKAATATAGLYLAYAGQPIFAEFSSANGGWSSAGGKPYLVAQEDPYDGVVAGSANWGHAWTRDVSAAAVQAAYPSLGSVQRIVVTDRVGLGAWGGRVLKARLEGSKGTVSVTGTALRSALGLKSEWFRAGQVAPAAPPIQIPKSPPVGTASVPTTVRGINVSTGDRNAVVSWSKPASSGASKLTGYRVTLAPGDRVVKLPKSDRKVKFSKLVNGRSYSVSVVARNSSGASRPVTIKATPSSPFGYQISLPASKIWAGSLKSRVAQSVTVLGRAGVPKRAVAAVVLRVTATNAKNRSAWLRVMTNGSSTPVAQQSVGAGASSTNLLMVKPGSDGAVALKSSRAISVKAEVVGYQTRKGGVGRRLIAVAPTWLGSGPVASSIPFTLRVAGLAEIPTTAKEVLLQATVSAGPTATTVRVSPDGRAAKAVPAVTVPAGKTITVPVVARMSADGSVRMLATGPGTRVSVDVHGYYLPDNGLAAAGRVRALPPTRVFTTEGTAEPLPLQRSTLTVPVLGRGGVPSSGVSAVILNVVASKATAPGWLVVFPAGAARPSTRALSFDATATVRTTVIAKVGASGAVQVYLPSGSARVGIDVAGYVTG